MTCIQVAHNSATADESRLSTPLIFVMAGGAGLAVASLYYSQPMLGLLGADMKAGPDMIGLVPTLTQLGYALGILLLAPLGDRFDRRRIILAKAAALIVTLLGGALAPSIGWLLAASFATGVAATMAQDIVPAAATLAPEAHRGKVVGTVMTGLLLGILLSRVVSGIVAAEFGWRSMYVIAAFGVIAILAGIWAAMPRFRPTTDLSYGDLFVSMAGLWMRYRPLRRAALAQGLLSLAFSAFWSTLAMMLLGRYGIGAAEAGAFGLVGAAGAAAAPLAGRLADSRGPRAVVVLGAALATLSFAGLGLMAVVGPTGQLVVIGVAAIGFDFGVQAALVAHQTIIYGLDPGARSRLNALLFTGMFIGMASGSALGSLALAHYGWTGVIGVATVAAGLALVVGVSSLRHRAR